MHRELADDSCQDTRIKRAYDDIFQPTAMPSQVQTSRPSYGPTSSPSLAPIFPNDLISRDSRDPSNDVFGSLVGSGFPDEVQSSNGFKLSPGFMSTFVPGMFMVFLILNH
eukprot:CAMPEP_0168854840 /NCGR_PEP_ID=MMETSP0727-20121128/14308_1 /TAXON_ID=265536 /ORGANISM="Amphiprora sp., Strain CCMP467" /LENGTH=109 /DNA_ID=CAMNT_0008909223 /DNA_START=243 /DNA_END=572 /DNA_ORIENTATION=+